MIEKELKNFLPSKIINKVESVKFFKIINKKDGCNNKNLHLLQFDDTLSLKDVLIKKISKSNNFINLNITDKVINGLSSYGSNLDFYNKDLNSEIVVKYSKSKTLNNLKSRVKSGVGWKVPCGGGSWGVGFFGGRVVPFLSAYIKPLQEPYLSGVVGGVEIRGCKLPLGEYQIELCTFLKSNAPKPVQKTLDLYYDEKTPSKLNEVKQKIKFDTLIPYLDFSENMSHLSSVETNFSIGWDTEFVNVDNYESLKHTESFKNYKKRGYHNQILTTQFYINELDFGFIIYHKKLQRFSLNDLINFNYEILKYLEYEVKSIHFVAHYSTAEIFSLTKDSFKNFQNSTNIAISYIQKSMATTGFLKYSFKDKNENKKTIDFRISDTYLLSNRSSLDRLGTTINIPKVEVKEHEKSRMDLFLKNDTDLFNLYALVDAYISIKYYKYYEKFVNDLGLTVGITVSSLSEKYIIKYLKDVGIKDYKVFLGYEAITKTFLNKDKKLIKHKVYTKDVMNLGNERSAYYGGRNETYLHGVYPNSKMIDYDIANAYPLALLSLKDIDFECSYQLTNENVKEVLNYNDVGFIKIDFKFKSDVKYPSFPIQDKNYDKGLIFPLEGSTSITPPELYQALHNDVLESFNIQFSQIFKKKETSYLSDSIKELIELRKQYPKKEYPLENELCKLIANSVYGKYTQGIKDVNIVNMEKTINNIDNKIIREISRESKIFNGFIASYITGFCRAIVSDFAIQLNRNKTDIVSITTDGFMCINEVPKEIIKGKTSKFLNQVSELRYKYFKDDFMEIKHFTSDKAFNIAIKTRGYANYDSDNIENCHIAKAGVKFDGSTKEVIIEKMIKTFLKRNNQSVYNRKTLTNLVDYLKKEGIKDLTNVNYEVAINYDYDFKRVPKKSKMLKGVFNGMKYNCLTFDTAPFKDINQFHNFYKAYDSYKKGSKNKVTTITDIENLNKKVNNKEYQNGYKVSKNGNSLLKKIIYIYLIKSNKSNSEIATILNKTPKFIRDLKRSKTYLNLSESREIKKIPIDVLNTDYKEDYLEIVKDLNGTDKNFIDDNLIDY